MSLAQSQVPLVRVVDSRIADNKAAVAVMRGPKDYSPVVITADGDAASTTNVSFTINPPTGMLLSRRILLRMNNLALTFSAAGNAANSNAMRVLNNNDDALTAWPLNRMISTCAAQINNTQVSCNIHDALDSFLRTLDKNKYNLGCNSFTPNKLD